MSLSVTRMILVFVEESLSMDIVDLNTEEDEEDDWNDKIQSEMNERNSFDLQSIEERIIRRNSYTHRFYPDREEFDRTNV